jgi:hypothetical protein
MLLRFLTMGAVNGAIHSVVVRDIQDMRHFPPNSGSNLVLPYPCMRRHNVVNRSIDLTARSLFNDDHHIVVVA